MSEAAHLQFKHNQARLTCVCHLKVPLQYGGRDRHKLTGGAREAGAVSNERSWNLERGLQKRHDKHVNCVL